MNGSWNSKLLKIGNWRTNLQSLRRMGYWIANICLTKAIWIGCLITNHDDQYNGVKKRKK